MARTRGRNQAGAPIAYLQAWLSPTVDGVVTPAVAGEALRAHAPVGKRDDIGLGWFLGEVPAPVRTDVGRVTSYVLTGISAVGMVLLALLAWRVGKVVRENGARRRGWVHAVRSIVVGVVAVGLWFVLPPLLTSAGMPAPFGIRGYPFDVILAAIALLGVPTAWAGYFLGRLVGSVRGSRVARIRANTGAGASG